jgi:DNA-binding response OmpR family regulator
MMRLIGCVRVYAIGYRCLWSSAPVPDTERGLSLSMMLTRFISGSSRKNMKILLADQDRDLVEMLMGWLKSLGYEVSRAFNADRLKSEWAAQQPDLIILTPTLKDTDGLALCHEMRGKHDALVLVLGDTNDVHEEVRCLESGADDYLRKPFHPSHLLARIRAVSRRARSSLAQRPPSTVTVGPIFVDSLHNQVRVYGKAARLTPTESKLLHLLAINADDVCTSNQIVTYVWGYDDDADACLIKSHIRHLRQKIEPDPGKPRFIITVPGVGYSLVRVEAGLLQMKGA